MAIKSPLRVATCPSWRLMPTGGAACVGDTGWPSKILLTSLRSTICISGSSCRCGMFLLFQKKKNVWPEIMGKHFQRKKTRDCPVGPQRDWRTFGKEIPFCSYFGTYGGLFFEIRTNIRVRIRI